MKINRKSFLSILNAVKSGLTTKETVEYSTQFIFAYDKIITYNDKISVCCDFKCDVLNNTAIQSKELLQLLEKLTDDEIELVHKKNELHIISKCAKAGINLELANIDEFINALGRPEKWYKLPNTFLKGINFCLFSASKDVNKELLTCIYINGSDVISSDDKRITYFDLNDKKSNIKNMLLPANIVKELQSYEPIEYSKTSGWLHFKNKENITFSCRTISGNYMIEKALEIIDSVKGNFISLPSTLHEILIRADIFSSNTSNIMDNRITIILENNTIIIKGEGKGGWIEETTRIRYKDDPIEFSIDPNMLNEILQLTKKVIIGERMLKFEGENFKHVVCKLIPKAK